MWPWVVTASTRSALLPSLPDSACELPRCRRRGLHTRAHTRELAHGIPGSFKPELSVGLHKCRTPEVLTDLPQKKEAVFASLIATWESEVLGWELTPGTWCLDGAT